MLKNVNSVISSQLAKLIKERGLKDSDILRKCGFTRPTLVKIKNEGNINIETLAALANGLGVKVSYFLDEEAIEHYESRGSHGILAKNIEKIDNREVIIKSEDKIEEDIILPSDCSDEAKHIIERLQMENEMLKKLLQEKERFITHLLERK